MSKRDDGGPAFPQPEVGSDSTGWSGGYAGMSLRDYFAAQAIPATMLACEQVADIELPEAKFDAIGIICYRIADAMLKARKS